MINLNMSGIVAGIIATGGVITTAIRDHIVLWHVKKDVDNMNDPKTGIQVQLGRHYDKIMDEVTQIGKQAAEVKGALTTIMKFIKQNNKEK